MHTCAPGVAYAWLEICVAAEKKALARIVTNEIRSTRANLDGRENETGSLGGENFEERRAGKSEAKTIALPEK